MPKFGLTMTEGTIQQWFKSEGDTIKAGEALFEVETEKVLYEVEAPADGTVAKLLYAVEAVVGVGLPVAVIAEAGEEVAEVVGIPKVRLLRLCGDEWGMKLPRYSLLALIAYRGEATVAEAHRALDTSKSAAKSLLWRARKAGWVTWDGRQYWRLAEGVVTDLAALNAAVLRGEEEVAATLAEGLGRFMGGVQGPLMGY